MDPTKSYYVIPCPCGTDVQSHEPDAICPKCGTRLVVENWGKVEAK